MFFDLAIIAVVFYAVLAWGSNEPWAMGLIAMGSLALLAARLAWNAWRGEVRFRAAWAYLPLLLFLGLVAGQPSTQRYSTIQYLLLVASYIVIVFLVQNNYHTREQVRFLLLGILVLGAFEAVYGLVQYLGDYGYIWQFSKKHYKEVATGTLINRNHYALLLNLCIGSGVGYLYYRSTRFVRGGGFTLRRFIAIPGSAKLGWLLLLLALMGLALIFSMSRMGIAAMILSVGTMIIAGSMAGAGKRTTIIGLLLIVAIVGLALYTGLDTVLVRYENLAEELASDRDRISLWRDAWKMIQRQPLLGQGLGTFRWTFPAYERVLADTPANFAHNDYLQALAEVGIVGLLLLLWTFAAAWRTAMRNLFHSEDPLVRGIGLGTIGALTAIALQEITDFGLYIPGVAMLAALIVGLNLRAARAEAES